MTIPISPEQYPAEWPKDFSYRHATGPERLRLFVDSVDGDGAKELLRAATDILITTEQKILVAEPDERQKLEASVYQQLWTAIFGPSLP